MRESNGKKGRGEKKREGREGKYVLIVVAILAEMTRADYWELAFLLDQDDEGGRLTYGEECSKEKKAMESGRRLASVYMQSV